MATHPKARVHQQLDPFVTAYEWVALLANEDGEWVALGAYSDKSVHVYSTFGGATVTLEGSSEDMPSATNAVSLTDPTQTLISITAKGMKQVLENPLYFRPKVTGGDGTTSLTVRLVCRV